VCRFDGCEQLVAGSQAEVFRQVGEDEPALAARFEVGGQAPEDIAEHGTVPVVDALFEGRGRPGGEPGRVADDGAHRAERA